MKNYKILLFLLAFAVILTGFGLVSNTAQAAGAASVNVSATASTISGTINAGLRNCGSSDGGASGTCLCCNVPPPDSSSSEWETCDISSASYVITNSNGTQVDSGTVSLTTTNTPQGCTTSCTTNLDNMCNQSASFSFSTPSNLSDGTYTATVTSTDCAGNNSGSDTFTISSAPTLSVSCSASPTSISEGESVTYTINASGGTSPYEYRWRNNAGDWDAFTSSNTRNVTYNTSGTYSSRGGARGDESEGGSGAYNEANCPDVTVSPADTSHTLYVNSTPITQVDVPPTDGTYGGITNYTKQIEEGDQFSLWIQRSPDNHPGYSFEYWQGCTGTGAPTYPHRCDVTMPSSDKTVIAHYTANEPPVDESCTSTSISVSSNRSTSWTITGPQSYTGSGTSGSYSSVPEGTYSISASNISGYTKTYSPSSDTVSSNNCSISFDINYGEITYEEQPPIVDITANGSQGPITVLPGASVDLDWGVTNLADSCTASGAWSGGKSKFGGSETVSAPSSNGTYDYGISCSNGAGSDFDSVRVYVNYVETNDATCEGITAPSSVGAGKDFNATITMKNTGSTEWDSTYRAGSQNPQDNKIWGTHRVFQSSPPSSPGETVNFTRTFTAPSTTGTYNFDWRMVEELVQWFGGTCTSKNINVVENGTIIVNSDIPTTWTGNGDEGFSQGTKTESKRFTDMPFGTYTIIPGDRSDDGYPEYEINNKGIDINQASLYLSPGGTITFNIDYKAECEDTKDNDDDGKEDYPDDPGCDSLGDTDEYNEPGDPAPGREDFYLESSNDIRLDPGENTGDSNESTITVQALNGFSDTVSLSASSGSLPGDTTYNFNDASLSSSEYTRGSKFSVTIANDSGVADGVYPIEVKGTGGGYVRSVVVNLLVNAGGVQFEEF